MTLPVIIVSYNTSALLRRCLVALQQSEGPRLDSWIVDNGSSDGTLEMLRSEFPAVHLLAQETNLGFSAGNNVALMALGFGSEQTAAAPATFGMGSAVQAASQRTPEYVLLLNPDTEVRPAAIAILLDFMRSHPRAAMVGPQLIYPDGTFQHSAFRFPGISQTFLDFFPLHHRLLDSRLNGRYPRRAAPFAIDHPLGACMLVRADAIRQVGLLDEGYFMYVEEIDWCRRLRRAGWEVWCEPRAMVVHHEAQSTRQFRAVMMVQLWRSRDRYFRNYHGPLYVGLIHTVMRFGFAGQLWRLKHEPALSPDERARRAAALAEVNAMLTRP